jgi:hypothetical protein
MENIMENNGINETNENENNKSVIKNDDIIVIKTEKEIFKFRVKEVKVNSCGTFTVDKANLCDAGDFCNIIYKRYSRGHKMGCQNLIFKKQD